MPTYEYRCEACGHEFEQFQSITARPLKKCPECTQRKLHRLIGSGGGIIFKGSGFYQTDYRSAAYKKSAEADKSSSTSSETKDKPEASTSSTAAQSGAAEKKKEKGAAKTEQIA
ncbi:MAG: zinc ribbon domain-containing protein [Planctomycetota bacterium]